MTKWRKPVRNKYSPLRELYNFVFKYFYQIPLKQYFIKWKIRIHLWEWILRLIYENEDEGIVYDTEIKLEAENRKEKDQIIYEIQEFLLNSYYYYERDWKPLTTTYLAKLLWVSVQALDKEIKQVLRKAAKEKWITEKNKKNK